jgi:hypothetical protein
MPNTVILTIPTSVFEFVVAIARAALHNAVPGDGVYHRAAEAVHHLEQALSDCDVIHEDETPQVPPQTEPPAAEA